MSVVQEDGGAQRSAGVWRRFGAMLYDSLLVIALMMLLTAVVLPLTGGEAIMWSRFPAVALTYNAARVLLVFGFFGWFWTRRGQTLGMAAWRMRIEREDGRLPGWGDAVKRFAGAAVSLAALGLGYFWIWVDRDRLAWHDRWSRTRVVVLPKRALKSRVEARDSRQGRQDAKNAKEESI